MRADGVMAKGVVVILVLYQIQTSTSKLSVLCPFYLNLHLLCLLVYLNTDCANCRARLGVCEDPKSVFTHACQGTSEHRPTTLVLEFHSRSFTYHLPIDLTGNTIELLRSILLYPEYPVGDYSLTPPPLFQQATTLTLTEAPPKPTSLCSPRAFLPHITVLQDSRAPAVRPLQPRLPSDT